MEAWLGQAWLETAGSRIQSAGFEKAIHVSISVSRSIPVPMLITYIYVIALSISVFVSVSISISILKTAFLGPCVQVVPELTPTSIPQA